MFVVISNKFNVGRVIHVLNEQVLPKTNILTGGGD
jgi:hypothetical protein